MDNEKRVKLIREIALSRTDNADIDTLMDFFFEYQYDYLDDLSQEELEDIAEENDISIE